MRYLVVYDVGDDHVRNEIADTCEAFGQRVQESVFECDLKKQDYDLLLRRLEKGLDPPDAGNIRIYRLCRDCLGASLGLGAVLPGLGEEPCTVI